MARGCSAPLCKTIGRLSLPNVRFPLEQTENERIFAAARAEAQASVAELQLQLEAKHQKERDEWDR
jgi:hypothetical protein